MELAHEIVSEVVDEWPPREALSGWVWREDIRDGLFAGVSDSIYKHVELPVQPALVFVERSASFGCADLLDKLVCAPHKRLDVTLRVDGACGDRVIGAA